MSDRPDIETLRADYHARAIDQARREGYAAGVRAAAEVADAEFEKWQIRQESSVNDCYAHAIRTSAAIRALDGKGCGV